MKEVILIPSYEPDNKLIELIDTIDLKRFMVIVINDGSGKKYQNIYDKLDKRVKLISYNRNKGKGYALKKGFRYIKENLKTNYIVVTMDCDGQHLISDAEKLLAYVKENPNSYVLGMRKRNENTPLRSKIGNAITMHIYKLASGVKVYDTQTGLRAFTDKLMDFMLEIKGNRFEYEMNCLLEVPKSEIKIHEIEIETIYYEKNKGSHFKVFRDSYLIYKDILKYSLTFFICFFFDILMFIILNMICQNVLLSNILSGFTSFTVYYLFIRERIMENTTNLYELFIKYSLLAVIILILNCLLLHIFVEKVFLNSYFAKLITNILFLPGYFLIHRKIVFKR